MVQCDFSIFVRYVALLKSISHTHVFHLRDNTPFAASREVFSSFERDEIFCFMKTHIFFSGGISSFRAINTLE